jgi:signal transduction histidine kinase
MASAGPRRADGRAFARDDLPTSRVLAGEVVRGDIVELHPEHTAAQILMLSAVPLREAGTVVGALIVSREVSGLDRLQEEHGRFVAIMVHELRTPLTSAWGQVQIARRTLDREGSASALARALQAAETQLRRLRRLLAEIPATGPTVSSMFGVTLAPTDVVELAQNVTGRHGAHHHLEFRCDRETLMADIDADRIEEVLENLLANAERYTPEGGAIVVELEQPEPQKQIRLHVSDSGIGVPESDRPLVFEPFSRGSNVGELSGSGIGLYVSRLIALRHGGDLVLGPSGASGATFTLVLPARVAA